MCSSDLNPNWNLEERRWRAIASLIRRQDGVIVVEQLMPYLDEFHRSSLDEEVVLSTLLRFNGRPHVSPEGDLVYAFPELQVTAQDRRGSGSSPPGISLGRHFVPSGEASLDGESGAVLPYLRELPWRFSEATPAQQTTAVLLGIVLLILSLFLRRAVLVFAASLGAWSSWFSALALLGLAYGSAFLLLPFVRWLWLSKRNVSLRKRNAKRWKRAQRLQHGSSALRRKLGLLRDAPHLVQERRSRAEIETLFSPSTRYRDLALGQSLFHWESQSTTTAASPTGQRYIHHAARGSRVLLFVREQRKQDGRPGGPTEPFVCLG